MAVGYRAIFAVSPREDALAIAREFVHSWLVDKLNRARQEVRQQAQGLDFNAPFAVQLSDEIHVTNTRAHGDNGQLQQLIRLDESPAPGETWRVNITADRNDVGGVRQQTIMVELDPLHLDAGTAVMRAAPPRFVRDMLTQHVLRSGTTVLTATPKALRGSEGGREAYRAVIDPLRQAQAVIAAQPPGSDMTIWQAAVDSLTRQAMGITTALTLDEDALDQFNRRLPRNLQLQPGEVRTFAPHVDLDDTADSLRHRSLGPGTFARHIKPRVKDGVTVPEVDPTFASVHARRARMYALEQPLPDSIRSMRQQVRTGELREERDRAAGLVTGFSTVRVRPASPAPVASPHRPGAGTRPSPTPTSGRLGASGAIPVPRPLPPSQEKVAEESTATPVAPAEAPQASAPSSITPVPAWQKTLAQLVWSTLGTEEITKESIELLAEQLAASGRREQVADEQIANAVREAEIAAAQHDDLRARLEDAELAAAAEQEERESLAREVEHLRRKAIEAERYEDLVVPEATDEEAKPSTFDDLIERIQSERFTTHEYVVFTGDMKKVNEVEAIDIVGRHLSSCWEFVLTLEGYARAKKNGFNGGVHQYLTSGEVDGKRCSPGKHASLESESVKSNAAQRRERLLPVPKNVDRSGAVHMWAHFKCSKDGTKSPRMHYYDDTDNTGKIYIGYIGPHLTNRQTSSM